MERIQIPCIKNQNGVVVGVKVLSLVNSKKEVEKNVTS